MKIIKNLIFATFLVSSMSAGTINAISVIVNEEPITLFEIYKYSKQFKISKKEAIEVLIRQKIEDNEIKKRGITVNTFEVDNYMEKIARKSGINLYEYNNFLMSKNVNLDDYKDDIKNKLKKDKLYDDIFAEQRKDISTKDMKDFYGKNLDKFTRSSSYDVSIYTSSDRGELMSVIKNPMASSPGVQKEDRTLMASQINAKFNSILANTKEGYFTKIMTVGDQYASAFIKSKNGNDLIPFEEVKDNIYRLLNNQDRVAIINDYIEKLKASAQVDIIRSPV